MRNDPWTATPLALTLPCRTCGTTRTRRRLMSLVCCSTGPISSGATFAAALKVAAAAPEGAVLLAMLPDTGERYLTTVLFEGIADGSPAAAPLAEVFHMD